MEGAPRKGESGETKAGEERHEDVLRDKVLPYRAISTNCYQGTKLVYVSKDEKSFLPPYVLSLHER